MFPTGDFDYLPVTVWYVAWFKVFNHQNVRVFTESESYGFFIFPNWCILVYVSGDREVQFPGKSFHELCISKALLHTQRLFSPYQLPPPNVIGQHVGMFRLFSVMLTYTSTHAV